MLYYNLAFNQPEGLNLSSFDLIFVDVFVVQISIFLNDDIIYTYT